MNFLNFLLFYSTLFFVKSQTEDPDFTLYQQLPVSELALGSNSQDFVQSADNNYLFNIANNQVQVIDIQDPSKPSIVKEIGFADILQIPSSLSLGSDDILTIGLWTGGIAFIDVSVPASAFIVKEYGYPSARFLCTSIDSTLLFSAVDINLEIYDISNWRTEITKYGESDDLDYPVNKITFLPNQDRYLFVAAGKAGQMVFDTDPEEEEEEAETYDTGNQVFPIIARNYLPDSDAVEQCEAQKLSYSQDGQLGMSMQPLSEFGVPIYDLRSYCNCDSEVPAAYIPIIYVFWNGEVNYENLKHSAFTEDNSELYILQSGNGIVSLDIQGILDGVEPTYRYVNRLDGFMAINVMLQSDDAYMFTQSDSKLQIFMQENLSQYALPNFFNFHLANVFAGPELNGSPWQCSIFEIGDKMYFINAYWNLGTYIFDITDPKNAFFVYALPVLEDDHAFDMAYVNPVNPDFAYCAGSDGGESLIIYDITDVDNPVFYSSMSKDSAGDPDDIVINSSDNIGFIANGVAGIKVVDLSDKLNPAEILNKKSFNSVENIHYIEDSNILISVERGWGIQLFDTTVVETVAAAQDGEYEMETLASYYTKGAEDICIPGDFATSKIIYVVDPSIGLTKVSLADWTQPVIVSRIELEDPSRDCEVLGDDKYVILTMQTGGFGLIDVSDGDNLELIAAYTYQDESEWKLQLTPDKKYAIAGCSNGLRIFSIYLEDVIHINYLTITTEEGEEVKTRRYDTEYKVGQVIETAIMPVQDEKEKVVVDVFHYNNYEKGALPSSISYDTAKRTLTVTVDKELSGVQLVLMMTKFQITWYYLQSEWEDLTETEADDIIAYLIEINYLDSDQGLVTDYFTTLKSYSKLEEAYTDGESEYIFKKLQQSLNYIPLKFFVEGSLILNNDIENTESSEDIYIIETYSDTLRIIMTLQDTSYGEWVAQSFTGVSYSVEENGSILDISGGFDQVNQILNEARFHRNDNSDDTAYLEDIVVVVTIEDGGMNDELYQEYTMDQLAFVKSNNYVGLSDTTLQEQFDSKYSESKIQIKKEMEFIFTDETFTDEDDLTFSAEYYDEENSAWKELTDNTPSFWLSFYADTNKLVGSPPKKFFGKEQKVRITATDGYSESSDEFTMLIKIPTAGFIVSWVVVALVIVGVFLFIFIKRKTIYWLCCKKRFRYNTQELVVGTKYIIQIPLTEEYVQLTQALWEHNLKNQYLVKKSQISQPPQFVGISEQQYLDTNFLKLYEPTEKAEIFDYSKLISDLKECNDLHKIFKPEQNISDYETYWRCYGAQACLNKQTTTLVEQLRVLTLANNKKNGQKWVKDWYKAYVKIVSEFGKDFPEVSIKEEALNENLNQLLNGPSYIYQNPNTVQKGKQEKKSNLPSIAEKNKAPDSEFAESDEQSDSDDELADEVLPPQQSNLPAKRFERKMSIQAVEAFQAIKLGQRGKQINYFTELKENQKDMQYQAKVLQQALVAIALGLQTKQTRGSYGASIYVKKKDIGIVEILRKSEYLSGSSCLTWLDLHFKPIGQNNLWDADWIQVESTQHSMYLLLDFPLFEKDNEYLIKVIDSKQNVLREHHLTIRTKEDKKNAKKEKKLIKDSTSMPTNIKTGDQSQLEKGTSNSEGKTLIGSTVKVHIQN